MKGMVVVSIKMEKWYGITQAFQTWQRDKGLKVQDKDVEHKQEYGLLY